MENVFQRIKKYGLILVGVFLFFRFVPDFIEDKLKDYRREKERKERAKQILEAQQEKEQRQRDATMLLLQLMGGGSEGISTQGDANYVDPGKLSTQHSKGTPLDPNYNNGGYDASGYNSQGYNKNGYDRRGFYNANYDKQY